MITRENRSTVKEEIAHLLPDNSENFQYFMDLGSTSYMKASDKFHRVHENTPCCRKSVKCSMNSSQYQKSNSRSEQFKYIPPEPKSPPKADKGSNKAYTQISQLLTIQKKMQDVSEKTCYPWQLNCDWTPPGLKPRKKRE